MMLEMKIVGWGLSAGLKSVLDSLILVYIHTLLVIRIECCL